MAALGAGCGAGAASEPNTGVQALRLADHAGVPGGQQGVRGRVESTRTASPASGENGATAEVLSAWRAAELAFESAARTADSAEPALAATTGDPQLSFTENLLSQMRGSGEAARGPVDLGQPTLVSATATEATVRACLHDAEIVYVLATGRPVPGIAGQVADELVVSLMARTAGVWKLVDQSVRVDACTPT